MRLIVDPDLCEGNGVCEKLAPEIFRLGDDDQARVLVDHPPDSASGKVEQAIRRCPRQAIRLVPD
jgi:ferredoxin